MSVSSRSPTTIGRFAPVRSTVSRCIGGSGFPATCGSAPVAIRTTSTAAPLPGAMPRAPGMVRSVLDANHGSPRRMAKLASANRPHVMSGPPYPWTTAAGSSSADSTGSRPRSRNATRSPSPPIASTRAPGGSWSATSRATAWAEVITSEGSAGTPSSVRCSATASGVRRALLVTYARCMPPARAAASESTAWTMASPPAYTTPSRSRRAVSYASISAVALPDGRTPSCWWLI
ncbi:hypothetical protein GA0115253_1102817 [Streptomyces sp. Termitarium-T10T-6]|nr:hypothetical protein GA0115253_1102817 [Streptomyces sp. Termitarium-T10T-6]